MAAVVSLDEEKVKTVLRQVEFYFSDSNLPRDSFLKKTVQESEDGLVSLALICSFSRMRTHLGLGASKAEEVPEETVLAVAEALRRSSSLRVSEDGKRIGRSSELLKPEEVVEQVDSRTITVAPLPHDVKIEDLESFFGQHGKVNSVRLPRHIGDKRQFCGTALVEFSEEEDAKKLLNESLMYAGVELELNQKKNFDTEREKKWEEFGRTRSNRNSSNEGYPRGLIVSFKLKSMSTEGSTEQSDVPNSTESASKGEEEASKSDNKSEGSLENVENENEEKVPENHLQESEEKAADNASEESKENVAKNITVESRVKNTTSANENNIVTREDLKQIFQKFGTVKYIDYCMGGDSGYIRFEDPDAAVKARAVAVLADNGGLIVKNFIATLEALTGDAEKEYWSTLRVSQEKRRENTNYRGRGGKHNRGGRHFDGKRSRQSDSIDGVPSNKVQKVGADA